MTNITGQRIREMRAVKGITQSELAEMLDKTCSAPRMWELGKSMPDACTIKKLAAYFGCSSDYLLDISDFKTEKEKMDFIHTEKIFHEQLNCLRDRDKMLLINGLNHLIGNYQETASEIGFGFEYISSLMHMVAFMLAEVKSAAERREKAKNEAEDDSEKKCEQNANGILRLGELKLRSDEALDDIQKKILSVYMQVISGVLCPNHDQPAELDTEQAE